MVVAEIVIREATRDDGDAIGMMWLDLVAYHQLLDSELPGAAAGGEHRYARNILSRLNDSHTRVLIAEDQGRAVGYVLGMIVDLMPDMFAQEPSGFLADIYVEPAYRRLGVGRALVQDLRAWFATHGILFFDWNVSARNPDGEAFWRAVGGQPMMIRMRARV